MAPLVVVILAWVGLSIMLVIAFAVGAAVGRRVASDERRQGTRAGPHGGPHFDIDLDNVPSAATTRSREA